MHTDFVSGRYERVALVSYSRYYNVLLRVFVFNSFEKTFNIR